MHRANSISPEIGIFKSLIYSQSLEKTIAPFKIQIPSKLQTAQPEPKKKCTCPAYSGWADDHETAWQLLLSTFAVYNDPAFSS